MKWDTLAKNLSARGSEFVRGGFDQLMAALGLGPGAAAKSSTFTIAFISLAAKMAKADGVVSPVEAQTFTQIYEVDPREQEHVMRVFGLAGADTAGFEVYARQIAHALKDDPKLIRDVFDGLFFIAAADGILHPAEDAFLRTTGKIFGLTDDEYVSIRSAFVKKAGVREGAGFQARANTATGTGPYQVLGLSPSATDAQIKARHRLLARDLHPDSLSARGVPAEFHAASERKLAVVNAAFDTIQRERGLRAGGSHGKSRS